jgi:hypothetical protein
MTKAIVIKDEKNKKAKKKIYCVIKENKEHEKSLKKKGKKN